MCFIDCAILNSLLCITEIAFFKANDTRDYCIMQTDLSGVIFLLRLYDNFVEVIEVPYLYATWVKLPDTFEDWVKILKRCFSTIASTSNSSPAVSILSRLVAGEKSCWSSSRPATRTFAAWDPVNIRSPRFFNSTHLWTSRARSMANSPIRSGRNQIDILLNEGVLNFFSSAYHS